MEHRAAWLKITTDQPLLRAHACEVRAGLLCRGNAGWTGCPPAASLRSKVYGQHRGFRDRLAAPQIPFVLATRSDDALPLSGRVGWPGRWPPRSEAAWERRSAGLGAHGPRFYDCATAAPSIRIDVIRPAHTHEAWRHVLACSETTRRIHRISSTALSDHHQPRR